MKNISLLTGIGLPVLLPAAALAAGVSTLHTFSSKDGFPTGSLVQSNGLLYGSSEEGVQAESGTIFSIDPATNTERDLYQFAPGSTRNPNDGFEPSSGLTALDGIFYGATNQGGSTSTVNQYYQGYGTIFAFNPATGAETPIHAFDGADGGQPSLYHDPLVASDTALYGTAYFNGPNGRGAIYKITPSGAFSIVYGFPANANGCNPTGIAVSGNTLYGTTAGCGANGGGNLFALNLQTGQQTILHSFASGSLPVGEPLLDGTTLVGVTETAGADSAGTVYKVNLTTGAYALLHTFTAAGNDGDQPAAGLTLQNGIVTGVTSFGPGQNILGTIFTVNLATGAEATVGSFTQATGYAPFGPLLPYDGALYGTTIDYFLESSTQQGSVFRYTP